MKLDNPSPTRFSATPVTIWLAPSVTVMKQKSTPKHAGRHHGRHDARRNRNRGVGDAVGGDGADQHQPLDPVLITPDRSP